mgnify:CR=1 FL=1
MKKSFTLFDNGLPGKYEKVETVEEATRLRNNLYASGHYPVMSICEAAGLNGDAGEHCPFSGTEDCTCDN